MRPWVILAGADGTDRWAGEALKAGVRGILAKSATVEHLFKAIRVVHRGEMWATSRVIAQTMTELAAATRLGITEATVKAHLSHVFQKLAIRGRAQLAASYARLPLDT